jgi:hypothetical protein
MILIGITVKILVYLLAAYGILSIVSLFPKKMEIDTKMFIFMLSGIGIVLLDHFLGRWK